MTSISTDLLILRLTPVLMLIALYDSGAASHS